MRGAINGPCFPDNTCNDNVLACVNGACICRFGFTQQRDRCGKGFKPIKNLHFLTRIIIFLETHFGDALDLTWCHVHHQGFLVIHLQGPIFKKFLSYLVDVLYVSEKVWGMLTFMIS